jgi:hypothetical protein
MNELDAGRAPDIEHFVVSYNRAQGREFVPEGRLAHTAAERILRDAIRAFAHGEDT